MELLEPITRDDICDLEEGEWIWDDKRYSRKLFGRHLDRGERISVPIGFRQIEILDLDLYSRWSGKLFMLSGSEYRNGGRSEWVHFEEGRFFRLRKE